MTARTPLNAVWSSAREPLHEMAWTPRGRALLEDDRASQIRLAGALRGKTRHVSRNAPVAQVGDRFGRMVLVRRILKNWVVLRCDCGRVGAQWLQNVRRLGNEAACHGCRGR